jgi:transposase
MTRNASFPEIVVAKAIQIRDQAETVLELKKALSVLLVTKSGLENKQASDVLGISERTVIRYQNEIRNQDDSQQNSWGGRRHYTLTEEEENEFLHDWETQAKEGGVLTVPPIHAALVEKLGRTLPMSTTYRLLARHGWRKVQPDTQHPKSDAAVQEEFKKNCPAWWQPPV